MALSGWCVQLGEGLVGTNLNLAYRQYYCGMITHHVHGEMCDEHEGSPGKLWLYGRPGR